MFINITLPLLMTINTEVLLVHMTSFQHHPILLLYRTTEAHISAFKIYLVKAHSICTKEVNAFPLT